MAIQTQTTETVKIERKLLPKQLEFIKSDASEVLYSGAFGAGKSRAICEKLLNHLIIPGNRIGLCRKTLKSLKATTLVTLIKGDGSLPPVLPQNTYTHHQTDCVIRMGNGSELVYFGLDDVQKIGSLNLGAIAIDEAIELNEDEWIMLRGRCRNEIDPHRQLFAATNPGTPSHFLAKRFGLSGSTTPSKGCVVIQTKSKDNIFLPKDYQDWLNSLTGTHAARYRDGKWVGYDGLVYDEWSRDTHIQSYPISSFKRFIGMIDVGFTNPSVILIAGIDGDDRIHIIEEMYQTGITPTNLIDKVIEYDSKYHAEWVCDPSSAGLIDDIRTHDVDINPGDNDVMDGITRVKQYLAVQADSRPRMTIDPSCEHTIIEMESYIWKPGKDAPKKELDHAMDALRYGVMHMNDGVVPLVINLERIYDEEEDAMTPEEYTRHLLNSDDGWEGNLDNDDD